MLANENNTFLCTSFINERFNQYTGYIDLKSHTKRLKDGKKVNAPPLICQKEMFTKCGKVM